LNIASIALRNVGRNKRRSILSGLAVAGAVVFLLFFMSFQQGTYEQWINNAVQAHSGHLQFQCEGYLKDSDMSLMLEDMPAVAGLLDGVDRVAAYAPRVNAPALISKDRRTFGALIWGVDPEREAAASTLPAVIKQGEYLGADDKDQVLLSELLAKNLGAKLGDDIVFMGQGADGSMAAGKLRVKGLFKFGINEIDRAIVVAHIETIQEAYSMNGGVSEIAVLLNSDADREKVVPELSAKLAATGWEDVVLVEWPELMPGVEQGIKMDWNSGLISYGVLVLIVAFGIANTFLMAFMERTHEYGVLLSLGMRPRALSVLAYLESLLLTAMGLAVGLILGLGLAYYYAAKGLYIPGTEELYAEYGLNPRIYSLVTAKVVVLALGIVGVMTAVMAIYPAVKAGRLKPVEALRRG
jgi:putative ABC transport system permease protein